MRLSFFRNKYLLSLLSNGSGALIGLLTMMLLFKTLPLGDMGDYSFFLSILLFFDIFRSGFISTAFINFYAGAKPENKDKVAGAAWLIACCITGGLIISNLVALLFVERIGDQSIQLFIRYFGIVYLLSLPSFMATCALQAKQHFGKLLILNLTQQVSLFVFAGALIYVKKLNVIDVIYCYIASNMVASLLALLFGWTLIEKIRFSARKEVKELFNFGKFNVGTNITSTLLGMASTFTIKFLLGSASLAIFNAGTKLVQIVGLPLRSMVMAAMPSMSEAYNRGDNTGVLNMTQRNIGVSSLLLAPVSIMVFILADYIILLLAGQKYVGTEAPNILRIYMFITFFLPTERFLALSLDVFRMPKINFMKVSIMTAIGAIVGFLGVYWTNNLYTITLSSIVSTGTSIIIGVAALEKYFQPIKFTTIINMGAGSLGGMLKSMQHKVMGAKK